MEWISWIVLLQPVVLSLVFVVFREFGCDKYLESKTNYAHDETLELIQGKLKHFEERAVFTKDLEAVEQSIVELHKNIEELQKKVDAYNEEDATSVCHGSDCQYNVEATVLRTDVAVVIMALIQLLTVILIVLLWRKVTRLHCNILMEMNRVTDTCRDDSSVNNNIKTATT